MSDSMPRGFRELDVTSTAAIVSWFGFAIWATYLVFVEGYVQLYAENGLIETTQAYLLAAACGIYLATLALEKRSDKLLLLACSLLCYGFILREVDVETFDIPRALVLIWSGVGRNTTLAAAILAICLYAVLTDLAHYRKAAAAFCRSVPGVLLMAGGVFLIIGELIEKNKMIGQRVFFEEMAELLGYVLILLSSIAANAYLSGMSIRSMRPGKLRG
ncbi:hypothetical protein [Caenimonas soli]|uniref:hypothetical protein n=1 Tax=Caenimonas soli TaxID=2735555 RepID=UPI001554937F|nr:hypothetical protein [Caenimonas soli]NPC54242.1 hypothetical protein [Caenimonas soli]